MLNYLVNWAKETKQVRKINLRVRTDNERAIALYQSVGFQIEGTRSREFLINEEFFDCHLMGMAINPTGE